MQRKSLEPLQTGLKAIDALSPTDAVNVSRSSETAKLVKLQ